MLPAHDHFSVLEELARPDGALTEALHQLVMGTYTPCPVRSVVRGRGPFAERLYVGSYATVPKKAPELEAEYYSGLGAVALCAGLELGLTIKGTINANHTNDEGWLFGRLRDLGNPHQWHYVLTTITSTMDAIEKDPHFGLASDNEGGRAAAVEMGRSACAAVARLNAAVGQGKCRFVQFHSGPTRHSTPARAAGVSSSSQALTRSLSELLALDWQGARLMVEHCDSFDGVAPVKGFLPLAREIEALQAVNVASAPGKVLLTINWARSVLETHEAETAARHVREARQGGVLGGLMFSGCSGVDGPYGQWKDTHMPHARDESVQHFAEGSLLTRAEMEKCIRAAGGSANLAYLGIKITAKHAGDRDVSARVGINAAMLSLVAAAASAAAGAEEEVRSEGPRAKIARLVEGA